MGETLTTDISNDSTFGRGDLVQVWKGTIRLSSELARSNSTVMVYSLNRFPINSKELRIGLLIVTGDDTSSVLKMGLHGKTSIPTTMISAEELTILSEVDPDRVLQLTNDYITLIGTPPSCIDRLSLLNHLKKNMITYLTDSLVKLRTVPDIMMLRDPVSMARRLRSATALTIIAAKDLHRLRGRRLRTVKPHLNELFREIPVSKSVIERAKEEIAKGVTMDPEEGWDVLSEFANLVMLPLLERVKGTTVTGPALPPATAEALAEAGRKNIIDSVLADNMVLQRSGSDDITFDEVEEPIIMEEEEMRENDDE
jgi:hypothetical protein